VAVLTGLPGVGVDIGPGSFVGVFEVAGFGLEVAVGNGRTLVLVAVGVLVLLGKDGLIAVAVIIFV